MSTNDKESDSKAIPPKLADGNQDHLKIVEPAIEAAEPKHLPLEQTSAPRHVPDEKAQAAAEQSADLVDSVIQQAVRLRQNDVALLLLFRIDQLLLPLSERQFTAKTSMRKHVVLAESRHMQNPRVRVTTTKSNQTEFYPKAGALFPVAGIVAAVEEIYGGSRLCFRTTTAPWVTRILTSPLNAAAAILIGYMATLYLLPHPILLFLSLVGVMTLPILGFIFISIYSRSVYESQVSTLIHEVLKVYDCGSFALAEDEQWPQLPREPVLKESFYAGLICGIIYVVLAVGIHAAAWLYWCDGKYRQCAQLCQPVVVLAQSVLGESNATVGDSKYYLAECYRCLGELDKAASLYSQAIDVMGKALQQNNPFYADAKFNLGRVYEAQQRLDDAEKQYKATMEAYAAFPDVGKDNIIYAKLSNRLAALNVKSGRFEAAKQAQLQTMQIDRRYGKNAEFDEDLNDLAAIEINLGNYAEAKKLEMTVVKDLANNTFATDQRLIAPQINLARSLLALKDQAKAQMAYEDAKARLAIKVPSLVAPKVVSIEALQILSKAYRHLASQSAQQARYEVPNLGTRANITFTGDGRL